MGLGKGLALSTLVVAHVTESGVEAQRVPFAADEKRGQLVHSAAFVRNIPTKEEESAARHGTPPFAYCFSDALTKIHSGTHGARGSGCRGRLEVDGSSTAPQRARAGQPSANGA